VVRLRNEVAKLLVVAGYQITAQRRVPNNLAWQLRLATGQFVNIDDTGSVVVQGVGSEPVKRLLKCLVAANAAQDQRDTALARNAPELLPSDKRPSSGPARSRFTAQSWIDADGYPIRLAGHRSSVSNGPPPPPPKVWDNPKTLRHMENRLRTLGYRIRSVNWFGPQWRIELETRQNIYYQDGGKITLGPFERDHRLERLFKIEGPQDQVARPLS
jgi:hypothetical protein